MAEIRITLAGFGGQGVLFAGKVIAYAGLIENKEVSWMPSYGPEMRGGTANCGVCISDDPIGSPLIVDPDAVIVLNQPSYDKFVDEVKPGGHLFVDSTLIASKCTREDIHVHYVPATQLANDNGLHSLANIIMVGKLLKETQFASRDAVEGGIKKSVPASKQHLLDGNLRALALGMEQ